jgi:hypothetical protein
MARLGSDQWSSETAASQFDPHDPRIAEIIDSFRRRAETITDSATAGFVVQALNGLADEWWAFSQNPLRYGWRSPDSSQVPTEDVLLRVPEGGRLGHWAAPQSLREVEELSPVRILGIHGP